MAALKTLFLLALLAAMLSSTLAADHVGPCDQVCPRIRPEWDECCRSHGPPTYDTIVVGLGSAGVTAATTLARAGRRVLGLEAQDRVGGRVCTVPFGDGIVEKGAEWIHGNQGNRVFDLAIANNVTILQQDSYDGFFRSDGGNVNKALLDELWKVYVQINAGPKDEPEPLGVFITRKLMEYITEKRPEVLNDRDFIAEFLAFVELASNNLDASNSWNDVSTEDSYEALGGHQQNSWGRNGYKTFFDIMLNKYNGGPGLPNLDIQLQTEVTSISVPQRPGERAVVTCKNGTTYEADNVIVTVSLGVLKAKHSSLFTSPLPQNKTTAIEKMSIGVVDKIILSFDTPWWPSNFSFGSFIWKGADKKKLEQDDHWIAKVPLANRPMGSGNTMTLWTIGEVAKEVESLPEDVVKRQSVELLQRFIGDTLNVTVPQPTGIIKSTGYSNPFTRGSYSFDNILTPQYPQARSWLEAPLTDSAGAPRVLFAGEATNTNHFSTVHGASETGYREAMRLLTTSTH